VAAAGILTYASRMGGRMDMQSNQVRCALLAATLLGPIIAQAQTSASCVPAVMSLSGDAGSADVAVLDMQGQWHVSSWQGVTWMALHAPDAKARCIARRLLLGSEKLRSDEAVTECTGHWGHVMAIVSADPIVRACGAVPACSVGDTCS
jgi:hypothetical protein